MPLGGGLARPPQQEATAGKPWGSSPLYVENGNVIFSWVDFLRRTGHLWHNAGEFGDDG